MNRWIFVGLMGAVASIGAGCGDDTTSTTGSGGGSGGSTPASSNSTGTSGDGGAGTGGGETGGNGPGGNGPGGGGVGGNLLGGCGGPGECAADERCDFRDGLCGAGEPGTCVPLNDACSDIGNERICLCGGAVVDYDYTCDDDDADSSGACELPEDTFACGNAICDLINGAYCHITSDDTGGADSASCGEAEDIACEDPTCECLAPDIEACGGTCEEGGTVPTVRCPGG